tara:strand:- start:90 stop:674 length:585 start_codon:yes stop_codon:yes gene_type:complete
MKFAYACGVTKDIEFINQVEQLRSIDPDKLLIDDFKSSSKRPEGLDQLVQDIRKGDELYFASIETIGKTARQILSLFHLLDQRGVQIISLKEGFDSWGHEGKGVLQFIDRLVDVDHSIRSHATAIGLKDTDIKPGPKKGSYDVEKSRVVALHYQQGRPVKEIMANAKIKSRETLYRYLEIHGIERRNKKKKKVR